MNKPIKLTKPQIECLKTITTVGKISCNPDWPPVKKIVELGYGVLHEGRYGGTTLEATESGYERMRMEKSSEKVA
jgi:hypothetical protein